MQPPHPGRIDSQRLNRAQHIVNSFFFSAQFLSSIHQMTRIQHKAGIRPPQALKQQRCHARLS